MKLFKRLRAFTLVELLVVMSIIAIIAGLAFPAITGAVTQSQLTQVLSNARQVHLAGQRAALDGTSTGDTNLVWPGDNTAFAKVADYAQMLSDNDYLPASSFGKIFSAPGVSTPTTGKASDLTKDNIAFTIYKISETNNANVVFLATKNLPLAGGVLSGVPFADKGFVTFRKAGDGGIYKKGQSAVAYTNIYGALTTTKLD